MRCESSACSCLVRPAGLILMPSIAKTSPWLTHPSQFKTFIGSLFSDPSSGQAFVSFRHFHLIGPATLCRHTPSTRDFSVWHAHSLTRVSELVLPLPPLISVRYLLYYVEMLHPYNKGTCNLLKETTQSPQVHDVDSYVKLLSSRLISLSLLHRPNNPN